MTSEIRNPDEKMPQERGGEYALEGFRYQATYTAKLCLELIDEETPFEEIFCEHHEDIVIKLFNGSFIAVQVKHNKPTGSRFTMSHEQIKKSLKRFVDFENEFKGVFSRYVIVSNNFAWSTQKNTKNVEYFLDNVRQYEILKKDERNLIDLEIKSTCKSCELNRDELLRVLKKTYIQSAYDYDDYEKMLILDIGRTTNNENIGLYRLILIKDALMSKIYQCSGINCDHPKKEYFNIIDLPLEEQIQYEINQKRIHKKDITKIINEYIRPEFVLKTLEKNEVMKIPKGFETMEKKMIIGGICKKSIDNVKNHKITVDEFFTEYYYKHNDDASKLYNTLRSLISTECDECYHSTLNDGELFGQKMFNLFSKKTHSIYDTLEKYNYHGLNRYHLLGISGILTEECELWWSKEYILRGSE